MSRRSDLALAIGNPNANRPGRVALVYDLMEPLRLQVDRLVLDFVDKRTFTPGDFTLMSNGVCRLHPQLARTVAWLAVGAATIDDVLTTTVPEFQAV